MSGTPVRVLPLSSFDDTIYLVRITLFRSVACVSGIPIRVLPLSSFDDTMYVRTTSDI